MANLQNMVISGPNATTPATTTATSTPAATGLPPYTTPPPDDQGNPPCEFGVDWTTHYGEPGDLAATRVVIEKNSPFGLTSQFIVLPDHYTVVVQTTDGRHHTQDDYVGTGATGPWDSAAEKDFIFRNIDPADIKHVVMTTSKGTCWVDGRP